MQGISIYPNSVSLDICWAVMGWCHMAVFIAGQNRRGRLLSHALTTLVCQKVWQSGTLLLSTAFNQSEEKPLPLTSRLSQMPLAIFPRVLASSGAIRNRSAQRLSSMCNTGSDLWVHSWKKKNAVRQDYLGQIFTTFAVTRKPDTQEAVIQLHENS